MFVMNMDHVVTISESNDMEIIMIIFPAIDIKDGKCVRLLFGEMEKETVYNNNPLDQAMWFIDQGAELYIVATKAANKNVDRSLLVTASA